MGEILPGRSIGQTFVTYRPNLDEIDVLLATYAHPDIGHLEFSLRPTNGIAPIVKEIISASDVADNQYRAFRFPPIATSNRQSWVLTLAARDATPGRALTAWSAPTNAYDEGTALVAGRADPSRDLTFVAYARLNPLDWLGYLARGLARDNGAVLLGIVALCLPGLALLGLLGRELRLDLASTIAIAPGLGVAVLALLFLWSNAVGLRLEPPILLIFLALSVPFAAAAIRRAWRIGRRGSLALLGLAVLAVATQMALVDGVDVPFWGDSYQHSVIVQLLLNHGGLFQSWRPYASLDSFTYHFGFHVAAASLASLAGLAAPEAVIVMAQLLAAAAALGSFAIARATGAGVLGGLIALVVVAFVSPMPSYYVNWGRDTQLAGLVVFAAVAVIWLQTLTTFEHGSTPKLTTLGLTVVGVAGLGLTHYRVILFFGAFASVTALISVARGANVWRLARYSALSILLVASGVAPWLPRLAQFSSNSATSAVPAAASWHTLYNAVGDLGFFVPLFVLVPAIGGVAVLAWRRSVASAVIAGWVLSWAALTRLGWPGHPAGALINSFSVEISLFMPASVAVSGLAQGAPKWFRQSRVYSAVLFGLLVGAAMAGSTHQLSVLDRNNALVLQSDHRALAWIRTATPPNARFLVNSSVEMGGTTVVGTDAGWWLPLLTGRQTTLPPVNYTDERMSTRGRKLVRDLATFPPTEFGTPTGLRLLREAGVTDIFIGAAGGRLSPSDFDGRSSFRVVFSDGPTRVYHVIYGS